jgi:WS/DGAT/MGAT family acyltransferase
MEVAAFVSLPSGARPAMSPETTQLSPVDAAWWHMEHPTNLMMITGALICRQPLNFAGVCEVYRVRLLRFRRFRQRVVESSLGLGLPHWEDDPYFNFDSHMHHIALPGEGTREQFADLLSDLTSTPLDYNRPLWQVHVIDNVMGGGALVMRLHHCIGDGTALVAVTTQLMDQEGAEPDAGAPVKRPHREHGLMESIAGNATWLLSGTRTVINSLLAGSLDGLQHPSHLVELAQQLTRQATRGAAVVGRALTQPNDPVTPLKGRLGVAKRLAWCSDIPVQDAKEICSALQVKINDVIVAAMTGALRRYLIAREVPLDLLATLEIHAVVPVDMRPAERAFDLGNVFGLVFLGLPVGVADPLERVIMVKKRMDTLKRSNEAVLYYSLLNLFGMTPKQVEENVVDFFGAKATMVFTNVVGPRVPLYMAGTEVDSVVFWVPQSGRLGMGISIYSYNGRITVGVVTDEGLAPDPERITDAFADEFRLLRRVAGEQVAVRQLHVREKPLCVATTRSGSACRNPARPGHAFCHRHLQLAAQPAQPARPGDNHATAPAAAAGATRIPARTRE